MRGTILNAIGFRFQALPAGVHDQDFIKFDVGRQIEKQTWTQLTAGGDWTADNPKYIPYSPEDANDDGKEDDETNPDEDGVFYSHDIPGWAIATDDVNGLAGVWNFYEFARVSLNGSDPAGNGVKGSRASGVVDWHSMANLKLVAGKLQRTTGDMEESLENNIGLGHVSKDRPGS